MTPKQIALPAVLAVATTASLLLVNRQANVSPSPKNLSVEDVQREWQINGITTSSGLTNCLVCSNTPSLNSNATNYLLPSEFKYIVWRPVFPDTNSENGAVVRWNITGFLTNQEHLLQRLMVYEALVRSSFITNSGNYTWIPLYSNLNRISPNDIHETRYWTVSWFVNDPPLAIRGWYD